MILDKQKKFDKRTHTNKFLKYIDFSNLHYEIPLRRVIIIFDICIYFYIDINFQWQIVDNLKYFPWCQNENHTNN